MSSTVSRRETRFLTASVATAACRRGPKAPAGSSAARVSAAQAGQRSRCSRCSVTVTAIGGSSETWWRCTGAASIRSSLPKRCAHAWHRSGQRSTITSTRSSGSSRLLVPSCPGWPPGLRPELGFRGRGGAEVGSWEGGSDELRELRRNRSSSFSTRASSRSYRASSARMKPTQCSRPASKMTSASCRSTPQDFAAKRRVPAQVLNAYPHSLFCRAFLVGPFVRGPQACRQNERRW